MYFSGSHALKPVYQTYIVAATRDPVFILPCYDRTKFSARRPVVRDEKLPVDRLNLTTKI